MKVDIIFYVFQICLTWSNYLKILMNTTRRFAISLTESIRGNEELRSKQCHYINITTFVALLIKQTVQILFYLVTFDPITLCDIKVCMKQCDRLY